jgi:ubiquinone/menaquinone biosynthesis C-methylase UbiE
MQRGDAAFTGSVPELYDAHLGPLLFEPYAADIAQRVRAHAARRILETAAGTGRVTRALAEAIPDARITATDLNPAMIAVGKSTVTSPTVTWQPADMLALPFESATFDLIVCQFGVMFVPDQTAAFREALRVLAPGGRYLFNVWDVIGKNEVADVVSQTIAIAIGLGPGEQTFMERTPHGYGDPVAMERKLRDAGFKRVTVEAVNCRSRASSAHGPALGLVQGSPMAAQIEAHAPGTLADVTARAERALIERFGSGLIDAAMRAYVFEAQA